MQNNYLKINPPSVESEKGLIDNLKKLFNNFPVTVATKIFNSGDPVIIASSDKHIINFLIKSLAANNYFCELINNQDENLLDKKRILIFPYNENSEFYSIVTLYSPKKESELIDDDLINSITDSSDFLECPKCYNNTPSEVNFCLYCGEDFIENTRNKYTLQIDKFLEKSPTAARLKIRKLFFESTSDLDCISLEEVLNNPTFSLTFISSSNTAEFIKQELESYKIETHWVEDDEHKNFDLFRDLMKFVGGHKNYFLGDIKEKDMIFNPSTVQVIKDTMKIIKSEKIKNIITACIKEIVDIVNTIKAGDKNANMLLNEVLVSNEKLLPRICNLVSKGYQIEAYLNSNSQDRIERELEKLLYQATQTKDNITRETYLQSAKTKELELENLENMKLSFERLQAQIIGVITSLKYLRMEVTNVLLVDIAPHKDKKSNTIKLIEDIQTKVTSMEEVLRSSVTF